MKKTDKKMENALRAILTDACGMAQSEYPGFQWLTHFVNFDYFPGSLSVICVFDTNSNLARANKDGIRALIKEKLVSIDINLKDIRRHIGFDTEENCNIENNGKWHERFR